MGREDLTKYAALPLDLPSCVLLVCIQSYLVMEVFCVFLSVAAGDSQLHSPAVLPFSSEVQSDQAIGLTVMPLLLYPICAAMAGADLASQTRNGTK